MMNIETTSATSNAVAADTKTPAAQTQKNSSDSSFKKELDNVKQQNKPENEEKKNVTEEKNAAAKPHIEEQVVSKIKNTEEHKTVDKNKDKVHTHTKKDLLETNLQALMEVNTKLSGGAEKIEKHADNIAKTQPLRIQVQKDDQNNINMNANDALFFANLVQSNENPQQELNMNNLVPTNKTSSVETQKSMQVSATLMDAMSEAMKNNKPLRIDFDKDVAVIIKIDKTGAISADFIPGDKAVENYLRNNIQFLKERFDEQNLAYNELNYRQSKQQHQENKRNKENNKDE